MNIQHSRILQPGLPPMFFSGNKKDMGSKWVVQAPKLETKKTCNGRMRSATNHMFFSLVAGWLLWVAYAFVSWLTKGVICWGYLLGNMRERLHNIDCFPASSSKSSGTNPCWTSVSLEFPKWRTVKKTGRRRRDFWDLPRKTDLWGFLSPDDPSRWLNFFLKFFEIYKRVDETVFSRPPKTWFFSWL